MGSSSTPSLITNEHKSSSSSSSSSSAWSLLPYVSDEWLRLEKLGEGTMGNRYKVRHRASMVMYCMKRCDLDTKQTSPEFIKHMNIITTLQHHNIVKLPIACISHKNEDRLLLFYEWMDTDVARYTRYTMTRSLPANVITSMMYQLFHGIAYCHDHGIIHRDLKPQNLLLNMTGELKIGSWDDACVIPRSDYALDLNMVTLWYRAPEILWTHDSHYGTPIDMWSIGCIFAELMIGQPLFAGSDEFDQAMKIFAVLGSPTESKWPELHSYPRVRNGGVPKITPGIIGDGVARVLPANTSAHAIDLLSSLLTFAPSKRITARDALRHPYFTSASSSIVPLPFDRPLDNRVHYTTPSSIMI